MSDPEIVDDRPQTVRLDVDRAERDRQLECASILLEGIGVEGDAPCRTVRPPSLSGTAQSEDAKHTSGSSPSRGDLTDDILALLPSPTSCRSDEKPSKDGRELIIQNNYARQCRHGFTPRKISSTAQASRPPLGMIFSATARAAVEGTTRAGHPPPLRPTT